MMRQRNVVDLLAQEIAFVSGIGRLPKAPGTFGSVPGLAVGALLHTGAEMASESVLMQRTLILAGLLAVTLVAYWAIDRTERTLGIHDDGRIVIDEVAGQALTVALFQPAVWTLLLGFALFRLFDIWKPGPIGWCDRTLPGALGTLLDDLLAGVCAALVLAGVTYFMA